jgi:hypothetical protein
MANVREDIQITKLVCDRCHEVHNLPNTKNSFGKVNAGWSEVHALEILESGDKDRALIPGSHRLDFCPKCTIALKNFIYRKTGVQGLADDELDLRKLDGGTQIFI